MCVTPVHLFISVTLCRVSGTLRVKCGTIYKTTYWLSLYCLVSASALLRLNVKHKVIIVLLQQSNDSGISAHRPHLARLRQNFYRETKLLLRFRTEKEKGNETKPANKSKE